MLCHQRLSSYGGRSVVFTLAPMLGALSVAGQFARLGSFTSCAGSANLKVRRQYLTLGAAKDGKERKSCMDKVGGRAVLVLVVVGFMAMGIALPKKAAAACSCRPDIIQVTTDAVGSSNNGCFQAKNRCKNGAKLGADDICSNLGYMGGSCNPSFTYDPCVIHPGPQYSVYCEVVASCIVCTAATGMVAPGDCDSGVGEKQDEGMLEPLAFVSAVPGPGKPEGQP